MTSVSTSSDPLPAAAGAEMNVTVGPEWVATWAEAEPATTELIRHGAFPPADQIQVIVAPDAIAQIEAHSQSDLSVELGGVLLGRAFHFQGRRYVEVTAALPAHSQEHSAVHFTFTADAWARIHEDREALYPDRQIIGWFHTHPDLGVFYSSDDVVVHTVAFDLPWHVGLVVDPVRREASFFGWTPLELVGQTETETEDELRLTAIAGFFEMSAADGVSVLPWQPAPRAAVWDYNPYAEGRQMPIYATDGMGPMLPPLSGWWGLGASLMFLGLLLLVFLFGVIPARRQAQQLAVVVSGLGQAQLATAVAAGAADCPDDRLQILAPLAGGSVATDMTVTVVGRAAHPNADRYQLLARPAGSETWVVVNEFRRDQELGQLARWATGAAAGSYELGLIAVDRDNQPVSGTAICQIRVEVE